MTDAEVMDKAMEILQGHWTKGFWCIWRKQNGTEMPAAFCVEGAITEAITGRYTQLAANASIYHADENHAVVEWGSVAMSPAQEQQYSRLRAALYDHWDVNAIAFNDAQHTTEEDVLLGMKHVREKLV